MPGPRLNEVRAFAYVPVNEVNDRKPKMFILKGWKKRTNLIINDGK